MLHRTWTLVWNQAPLALEGGGSDVAVGVGSVEDALYEDSLEYKEL